MEQGQEIARMTLIPAPHMTGIEDLIVNVVDWLRLVVETLGAAMVAVGVTLAVVQFVRTLFKPHNDGFHRVRLILARYLALALEFQLGADILSTAIAPTWDRIGKLAAIAVIRTVLNYFLMREMRETGEPATVTPTAAGGGSPQEKEDRSVH